MQHNQSTLEATETITGAQASVNESEFRLGVIPRAQLSMLASQIAVNKLTHKLAKEFATYELMEAIAVIDVLKELNTDVPALNEEGQVFIKKLKDSQGNDFDKLYMQAELSNHELLRDLAQNYLNSSDGTLSATDNETRHVAMIALFAFKEHVAISKRIYNELTA